MGAPRPAQVRAAVETLVQRHGVDHEVLRYALALCTPNEIVDLANQTPGGIRLWQQLHRERRISVDYWKRQDREPPPLPFPVIVEDLIASTPRSRAVQPPSPALARRDARGRFMPR